MKGKFLFLYVLYLYGFVAASLLVTQLIGRSSNPLPGVLVGLYLSAHIISKGLIREHTSIKKPKNILLFSCAAGVGLFLLGMVWSYFVGHSISLVLKNGVTFFAIGVVVGPFATYQSFKIREKINCRDFNEKS